MLSPNVLRVCVMLSGCIVAKFVVKIFKTHSLSNSGFSHIDILNFEKVHQPLIKREKDVSPILINSVNNLTRDLRSSTAILCESCHSHGPPYLRN